MAFFFIRHFTLTFGLRFFEKDFSWGYQLAKPRVFISTCISCGISYSSPIHVSSEKRVLLFPVNASHLR